MMIICIGVLEVCMKAKVKMSIYINRFYNPKLMAITSCMIVVLVRSLFIFGLSTCVEHERGLTLQMWLFT
jgi:hypothetical protein